MGKLSNKNCTHRNKYILSLDAPFKIYFFAVFDFLLR